ncbi:MAG: phosphoglycerate dehydrogenase [Hyphomicrobiales bacterium]|nr:phosphoglycerate dehydrogenase [Methylobacteriaceae bacterium]MCC2105402.1 phosphoglycerate dehydrogenase [Hyphomicrobiales bacterium]
MIDTVLIDRKDLRVLLLEGINETAVDLFAAAGFEKVERLTKALDGEELHKAVADAHVLGIRSRTRITAEVLAAAPNLMTVGCFSVGTNQVDIPAARKRGIPVFNAPFSNTRSVAELVIGEIVMLMRNIFPKSNGAHAGLWEKTADNSFEVRGKTLGIVGYGNIGSQLAGLAEAMGMRVVFFDMTDKLRRGNVEPTDTLEELLAISDVVSLHVPDTPVTRNMIRAEHLRAMKKGAYLINNARGHVVDIDALMQALKSGHLRGAAIDVFPVEPGSNKEKFVSPLQGLPNVILTPHIGGSTEEAQERIGSEVARKLADYADTGATFGAVGFPQVQLPPHVGGTRFVHMHRNVPGVLTRLNQIFAGRNLNIAAQYLQTDADIGYVVIDADGASAERAQVYEEMGKIDGTIRTRLL